MVINEIAAAKAAGRDGDFEVIALGTPDGERLMTAIDNLVAQGAQGFVVCAPDVRLGPAVVARSAQAGLKVLTVDDQFLGPQGRPLAAVPHLGMSGYKSRTGWQFTGGRDAAPWLDLFRGGRDCLDRERITHGR